MRTAMLFLLLTAVAASAQESPLEPKYPFTSCKLTYKRVKAMGAEIDMVVCIKGNRAISIGKKYVKGKLDETSIDSTDGTYLYDLVLDGAGNVKEAERAFHPWHYLAADYAELSAEEKKSFADALPKLWQRWSPIFTLDNLGTASVEEVKGTEKIAGKECEIFECKAKAGPGGGKFWRWQGTNIMLKSERFGVTLEIDKIEENAAIPDSAFTLPGVAKWKEDGTVFARSPAKEIFKILTGKEATADPNREPGGDDGMGEEPPGNNDPGIDAEITVEGKKFKLDGVRTELSIEEEDEENQLAIRGSATAPSIEIAIVIGKAKSAKSLVGKTFALGSMDDASNAVIRTSDEVSYESIKGTVKILTVAGGVLEAEVGGAFKRVDDEGERDIRLEKLIIKSRIAE